MNKAAAYVTRLLSIRTKQIFTICCAVLRGKITFYPEFVSVFERRFADFIGVPYGLTFCNGTSGIEAALFAIGLTEGDEVIVPSCTFHASIDAIVNSGGKPIFVDVDEKTLTANTSEIAAKLSDRTRAVLLVHLYGNPADVVTVCKMAKQRGIYVIEDASHAHGAKIGGKRCGGFGDIGVFSLQGNKAVAAGEGGVAVTSDERLFIRMSIWGHFDRHATSFDKVGGEEFQHTGFGFKRRIAPLGVLMADANLDHLDWLNSAMNETASELDRALEKTRWFRGVEQIAGATRGGFFYGYPVLIRSGGPVATDVIAALGTVGIEILRIPFEWHHKLAVYTDPNMRKRFASGSVVGVMENGRTVNLPVTESLRERSFVLPRRYLITMGNRPIKRLSETLMELERTSKEQAGA